MASQKSPKDWSPGEQFEADAIFKRLREISPDIAFSVDWEEDSSFVWDGEGPDPADDGYVAYDVDVTAGVIKGGRYISGTKSLGGVYDLPDEKDPDIHGYLPQMLEEAAEELEEKVSGDLKKQVKAARKYLKELLTAVYAFERRRRG